MQCEKFLKHPGMPFVECRYSKSSKSVFKPHLHAAVSIGAVDEGLVQYSVAGHVATLRPGTLALINPETLHSCNTLNENRRSYFMLYLDVDWCLTVQQSFWDIDDFSPFSTISLEDEELYQRYCYTVQQLFAPDIHLQEKEQMLVDLVSGIFSEGCHPQNTSSPLRGDVDRLKEILQQDLHKDLTLDSLAALLNANPYTLLRKFKARTGITPHAYRMNCRIDLARKYLSEGRDIGDTALECGFFDQSHLHRHFKAMTTVTPQKYRVNFIQ